MKVALAAALIGPCALLTLAAFGGQSVGSLQKAQADHAEAGALNVIFSGEQNGYLTPCGCSTPMLGGVPRRAGYIKTLPPKTPLVKVDLGDLTEAMGRQDEMKAETLVEMLNALAYDALAPGEKDFRLGLPYLQSLQARFKGALLCANVRKADGAPLFGEKKTITRTVEGKPVRMVLVGLLSEQFAESVTAADPQLKVEAPAERLEQLQNALKAAGDTAILLYHGPMEEAEAIAAQFPIFRLILCAHEGDHPKEAKRVGKTMLANTGQDGKYVGRATMFPGASARPVEARTVALGPEWKEDAGILAIKGAYLERVAAEDLLSQVPKSPTLNGDTYAGTAACTPCHAEAQRVWKASGHAHALQTLATVKHDRDPDCVPCHVVGLERQSGFVSRAKTPQLADVGCESCHGPAAKHIADPKSSLPKVGTEGCVGCHNPQNSPRFAFEKYWPKIRH